MSVPAAIECLETILRGRRSIRRFKTHPVPDEIVRRILQAAIQAPSGQNRQPWEFHVLGPKSISGICDLIREAAAELQKRISEENRQLFERYSVFFDFFDSSPLLIAVFARPYPPFHRIFTSDEGKSTESQICPGSQPDTTHIQSAAAAVENLILAAHACGLGSCWNSNALMVGKHIREFLGVRENWELLCLVALGYPDETPSQTRRYPLERVVRYHE